MGENESSLTVQSQLVVVVFVLGNGKVLPGLLYKLPKLFLKIVETGPTLFLVQFPVRSLTVSSAIPTSLAEGAQEELGSVAASTVITRAAAVFCHGGRVGGFDYLTQIHTLLPARPEDLFCERMVRNDINQRCRERKSIMGVEIAVDLARDDSVAVFVQSNEES